MPDSKPVQLELRGRVAIISLNRPEKLNAINLPLKQCLDKQLDTLISNSNVRTVVLHGKGRAFCAGGDVKAIRNKEGLGKPENLQYSHRLLEKLMGLEQIVIAAVHGFAYGAGCNLAMAADLVYAAHGCRFGQAFIKLGLPPDWGGMYILPSLVGLRKAKEWILLGRPFDAQDALACGAINGIFNEDLLLEEVLKVAEALAKGPWTAIRVIKKVMNKTSQMGFQEALQAELDAFSNCIASADATEGLNAFLEKRSPKFS